MISPVLPKSQKITSIKSEGRNIYLYSEKGILRICVFEESVFRISFTENLFNPAQGSEILSPENEINYSITEEIDFIIIKTSSIACKIFRATGSISFYTSEGQLLFSENQNQNYSLEKFDVYKTTGNVKTEEIKTADGVKKRIVAADKIFDKSLYHTKLNFTFQKDEKIFGLGQAEDGCWNLRSTTQYLNQANKKIAIPFFVSSKKYGILFTTQSPSIFSDTNEGSYFYTTADYYLDYFFIAASPIISAMRRLTGKALLPPKWAFGYIQSQERYESQKEILDTVAEFKNRKIPLSAIVLDWLSWEDGMWGQKSFDKTRFPSPDKMIETLHQDDVHFMISIWPSMDEKCENYKEMKEHNALLNGVNICNAFEEEARKLYWAQAKKGLADYGIESWWCDSSEPITPEWNHLEKIPPSIQFSEYVKSAEDMMPLEKSNMYGYYHALGMYEGQKKDFPDRRMLILTRSGGLGSQKLGVTLWSGDISASWQTLKNQIVAAIQFSLSGIPYWTFDIGGFFVKKGINWYWNGEYDDTTANAGYRELYTRWFQTGAFLPMFRAHGTDCRREPWAFDSKEDGGIFYKTIVDFIKLRYRLMPYIYSVAAKVWKDDQMFLRPLFTDFDDPACLDISSQFMFGPSIMVCPVTKPMYFDKAGNAINKEKSIPVYLPSDCAWYDWWTGKKYDGGLWINADADISKLPLFIREGSEIPVKDENEKIEMLRFPDSQGNCQPFDLYDDDGLTNDYLK